MSVGGAFAPPLALGVVAAFFAGGLRYQLAQPSFSVTDLASYNDSTSLRLMGLVDAPPDVRDRSLILTVKAETLWRSEEAEPLPVKRTVRVQLSCTGAFAVGDRLEIRGKLITPPETAEYQSSSIFTSSISDDVVIHAKQYLSFPLAIGKGTKDDLQGYPADRVVYMGISFGQ